MAIAAAVITIALWTHAYADADEVQRLLEEGKAAEALDAADGLLSKGAKPDEQLRLMRGLALAKLGRENEAIVAFRALAREAPGRPEPLNNLAVLYGARGDLDGARSALLSAVRADPGFWTGYQNLGDVYLRLADRAYRRALAGEPENAAVERTLAGIDRLFGGEPATAGEVLRTAPGSAAADTGGTPPPSSAAPLPPPGGEPDAPPQAASPAAPAEGTRPLPRAAAPAAAAAGADAPPPATPLAAAGEAGTSACVPCATGGGPATANSTAADIRTMLHTWADAWSRRDAGAQRSYYAADTRVDSLDRRAAVMRSSAFIKVRLTNIDVDLVRDGVAVATFVQHYRSDRFHDRVYKRMDLARGDGGWKIEKETSERIVARAESH